MSKPDCPHCGHELAYHDYFGKRLHAEHYYLYPKSWIEKTGEIFKCKNEECEMFEAFFWTHDNDSQIHEGYPC